MGSRCDHVSRREAQLLDSPSKDKVRRALLVECCCCCCNIMRDGNIKLRSPCERRRWRPALREQGGGLLSPPRCTVHGPRSPPCERGASRAPLDTCINRTTACGPIFARFIASW